MFGKSYIYIRSNGPLRLQSEKYPPEKTIVRYVFSDPAVCVQAEVQTYSSGGPGKIEVPRV